MRQNLAQQRVGVDDQAGDLIAALAEHVGHLVGVGEKVAQLLVAGVESVGEPGHPLQCDLQVRWGVLEGLGQRCQRRGQLCGVQSADGGGQVSQRGRQVVGRLGPLERDDAGELAVPAWSDFEHLAPQHGLGLDRGLGAVPHLDAVFDGEVHQHLRPLKVDAGDAADRQPRHPHVAAGFDAARLGEVGGIVGGAVDERNLVVGEGCDNHGDHNENADRTHCQPIAIGQRLDIWSLQCEPRHLAAHRPVDWPTSLTNTGWPPLPFSFRIASQR